MAVWVSKCFGNASLMNKKERAFRFIEEALELVQACNLSKDEVLAVVEHVYSREVGQLAQEVAGAQTTLAALCEGHLVSLEKSTASEVDRIWYSIDKIREKTKLKPVSIVGENYATLPVNKTLASDISESAAQLNQEV